MLVPDRAGFPPWTVVPPGIPDHIRERSRIVLRLDPIELSRKILT
jgi:hypothetical protein